MNTRNIHQIVTFKASPKKVYHTLMNSGLHSKMTDSRAVIGTKVGSAFSVWEGGVHGINLVLDLNKKIVQAWRTEEWAKDHYSVAVFELVETGSGTRLVFDQYAVPIEDYKNISANWRTYYWIPMRDMFEAK